MPKPTALAAYVFAGGFTEGVKKHFTVEAHLEDGNYGVETSKAMHGVEVFTNPETWPTQEFRGKVDFVYANPPCAPWSAAGMKVKGGARDYSKGVDPRDPRVTCLYHVFQLLESVRPKVLAFESVWQIWSKGWPIIEDLAFKAASLGYRTSVIMHDGFDCGVPQHRKRAFIVFHCINIEWDTPNGPIFAPTVADAFCVYGDIEIMDDYDRADPREYFEVKPQHLELWKEAALGEKLYHVYDKKYGTTKFDPVRRKHVGRPGFMWTKINPERHAPTITGGAIYYHHYWPRTLTWREQMALCGYPRDYYFEGRLAKKFQQIAQAVMPPVGEWLARTVKAALEVNEPIRVGFVVRDFLTKDNKWEEVIS
jgi:DNA (cytosine-5)-methyltransferase 1